MEFAYLIGAVILAMGIGYALVSYMTRNRQNDAVSEMATRAQYKHDEETRRRAEAKKRPE